MVAFERKYGIRSETFYAAYVSGEEPEDDCFFPFFVLMRPFQCQDGGETYGYKIKI